METEEEENSIPQNPPPEHHNECKVTTSAGTTTIPEAVTANSDTAQHELLSTITQCEEEAATDTSDLHLATDDNERPRPPSPYKAETMVTVTREDQDAVTDVIVDALPPAPLSPRPSPGQPAAEEEDGVEVDGAGEGTTDDKQLHLQPPRDTAVNEEEDLIPGKGTLEVCNNEAKNAEVVDTVVNDDKEIKKEVVANLTEELESETGIKITDKGMDLVDDVTDELKADVREEETVKETALEDEVAVHMPGVSHAEFVSREIDSERPLETGAVADVVEELEAETFSEGIQMETVLESKAVTNMIGELGTGTATEGIEAEIPFEAQATNVAEDKMGSIKETEVVEEMKEEKLIMETEADDEEMEKPPDDDPEEELQTPEQTEMTDADKEELNEGDEIDEMEMVDEMEEMDKGEEMEVSDEMRVKRNEAEEMEEKAELEVEEVAEEVSKSAGGKRKRGRNGKTPAKATTRKKVEEDVCFICFDGGELVLCDRRGCPKAYHPSCVNRDETFFRSKGRWNCGWHLCSNCEKNAYYMCLTCTYSLCKGCIKDGTLLCVRGNKGFCDTCMKTIMLIEENEQGNKQMAQVDFDDKSSWEFLFKDYWIALKEKLSLTSEELSQAKHPWKGSELRSGKQGSPDDVDGAKNDGGSASDSSDNPETATPRKRKLKKRLKSRTKGKDSPSGSAVNWGRGASDDESGQWASKELLEFVMHMKNGDKSSCSQFDVQALLLEYIKRNKLRDPRRKSQIICDSRLQNLFGKPRVGHFEMLKLLESHFLLKDDSQTDDLQGSVVDMEANQFEADENSDGFVKPHKDKKRKSRKKGDKRGLQSNIDDYAAIDMHNINLIYLRRSLVEELIEDTDTFNDKVVGSFVRIRISGSAQKQDLYRLVQVVGTNKAAEQYRVGKKMTNFLLEILNLNKTEVVPMDIISNQEFTEDECKRLRQSIKCGLINRLTVGDIQEKAMALQVVRVQDTLETEITRVSHLRDRASDMGRRKELRECVEKLQLLKSPDERRRRLEEIPEIHTDPKMDPSYESEEDESQRDDKQENYLRPRGSGFNRRGREPISPHVGGASSSPNDSWGGTRNFSSINHELSRNMSGKGFINKGDNPIGAAETLNENFWSQGRDREMQQLQNWEKLKTGSNADNQGARPSQILESVHRANPEVSPTASSAGLTPTAAKINEADKIWHYQDPSGKIQGPFSMVQLRKWNNTGYFPADLRIWRTNEKQDDSILLADALNGKLQKEVPAVETSLLKTQLDNGPQSLSLHSAHTGESRKPQTNIGNSIGQTVATPLQIPNYSADRWGGSEINLPSPTPSQTPKGGTRGKAYESKWSPTPSQHTGSLAVANALLGGSGERLRHPSVIVPETDQFSHASSSSAKLTGHSDGINMSPGVRSVPKAEAGVHLGFGNAPHVLSQSTVPSESPRMQINSHQHVIPGSNGPSVSAINDTKTIQKMVQPMTGNALVGSHAWEASSISRPEMTSSHPVPGSGSQVWGNLPAQKLEPSNPISTSQPVASGSWAGTTNSVHSSASPFLAGNPNSGWRPLPGNPNLVSSSSFTPENPSNAARQGPENQNIGWGAIPGNPNVNWGGPHPANSNMGWVAPMQASAPASANPVWSATGQGQRPGNTNQAWGSTVQGQASANAFTGWMPSSQVPTPPNNANQAWIAPGQGPPANANTGWAASNSNIGQWGSDMNQHGDRFSGQKDRISQGGDSGFGGGKSWNKQPSFGRGDSSRASFRGQRVCKFHENGHCRKGAQCDYFHP